MPTEMTAALDTALQRYAGVAGLVADAREALAADADQPLADGDVDVAAFYIRPTEQLWTMYVLAGRRLVVHERTREGQTLTVAVPLTRITRVLVGQQPASTTVTVELDADQTTVNGQTEWIEADDRSDDAADGQRRGRQVTQSTVRRAGYVIQVDADDDASHQPLRRFARALTAAVG